MYYLHIQSLFPAAAMTIIMRSPAPLTPTCKTDTLGCSRGLFSGLWVVTGPVCRYRTRDRWAIPGPGPGATQTTGCASERRCGPSLQAGQGDSDGPPGCRRHPVWNGMYLSETASWQCARWVRVGRASGRDGLARFGAAHPALDRTRGERCVRAGTVTVPTIMITPPRRAKWRLGCQRSS
jgi:hypothetical protein